MPRIEAQPGPQTTFLSSPADIAIYGGAAGGGKSYALLLEPMRHLSVKGFSAVVFRRTLADVKKAGSLWDTSVGIYGAINGKPRLDTLEWKFAEGAKVSFGHLEHETTVLDWQGAQVPLLCCEVGTLVRMADGTGKPVEALSVGDMVQTLQGARAVTKTYRPHVEPCVRATIRGCDGIVIGEQVHAESHAVLTPQGWRSYADMCGEPRPSSTCAPKEFRSAHKFSGMSDRKSLSLSPLRDSQLCHSALRQEFSRSQGDRQSWSATGVYTGQQGRGNYFGSYQSERQELSPRPLIRLDVIVPLQDRASAACVSLRGPSCDGAAYALTALELLNSTDRYSACSHQCGELAGQTSDSDQGGAQRLDGVAGRIQTGLLSGDLGTIQKHKGHKVRYAHPYTGEGRTAEAECFAASCELTPCGNREVVHFTVSDENHYITHAGLVNKNCFDELTHFSRKQFFYLLSRNRSACGVRPYVRATTNPDADSWVAEFIAWWIDQDTGLAIPERAGVLRWFARIGDSLVWAATKAGLKEKHPGCRPKSLTFIPATLDDNAILTAADPDYRANLEALDPVERARLLGGNWKVRPAAGLYFQRHWCQTVDVIPAGTRFVRGWDLAATPKTPMNDPDWTAGNKIGKTPDGRYIVAHHLRLRGDPLEVERAVKNTAEGDGKEVRVQIPQDPAQAGKSQAFNFTKLLTGFNVNFKPASGDKVTRFGAFSAQAAAGNVLILRGPWNDEWASQLEAFPPEKGSGHDDDADATAEAFNALIETRGPMKISEAALRNANAGRR